MKIKKFKSILWMLTIAMIVTANLNAVTYEKLPNNSRYRGFYYYLSMANYQDLLLPTMPLEIMVGYAVADSLVRVAPKYPEDVLKKLDLQSDTVAHLYKHWCLMNDWNPLRFLSFLYRANPGAQLRGDFLESGLYMRMYKDPKLDYVYPSYILHIYVNDVLQIDTAYSSERLRSKRGSKGTLYDTVIDVKSETVAFCKVLDTLKGKVFPSLNDAIFYNGELPDSGTCIIAAIPPQTDIVFSYWNYWQRWMGGPYLLGWIKPGKEYIVFLEVTGKTGSANKFYYNIIPFRQLGSRGMYPIENGIVRDEGNILGFGERVPLNIFKQNIINKLEEIKNYGE